MQFIGIDVSKQRLHAAWLRDPQQGLTRPKAVDNSPEGHALLLAWAQGASGAPPDELCFVLEATGVYHEAVALCLHQAGAEVAVSNPLHVKRFAESHGIKTKNDAHDGRVLALYGHERKPKPWQPPAGPCAQSARPAAASERPGGGPPARGQPPGKNPDRGGPC